MIVHHSSCCCGHGLQLRLAPGPRPASQQFRAERELHAIIACYRALADLIRSNVASQRVRKC